MGHSDPSIPAHHRYEDDHSGKLCMVSSRKLQALQNLAERPGTEAEGRVARAMLEKLTGRPYSQRERAQSDPFERFDKLWEDLKQKCSTPPPRPRKAPAAKKKAKLPLWYTDPLKRAQKVRERFPIGSVIYYNARGWPINTGGEVLGYERAGFRVRVEFFSGVQLVHACSDLGWHLSLNPVSPKQAAKLQKKATP